MVSHGALQKEEIKIPLKILMIGGLPPWHPQAGGGQIIAYKTAEVLSKSGQNITYVAIAPKELQREIHWANFVYTEKEGLLSQFLQAIRSDVKYDIIHLTLGNETLGFCIGFSLKKLTGKSQELVFSLVSPKVHGFPRSFGEACWMASSRFVDVIFSLSEFSKKDISESYLIPKSKIRVTYAGVDDSFFLSKNKKESKNQLSLIFVGRLNGPHGQKGVDILLKAIPLIIKEHNIMLNIIGTGSRANEYKKLAKDLKVDNYVKFLGFVEHKKLPEYYANADLFVFPSRRESFGLVLVEAMAAGLPVVSTRVGAIPEVVKDGETGILVPPNNPQKFAEAVNFLLDHPDKMQIMGMKGKERVKEYFTWDKVAKRVLKYYEEIL